MDQTDATEDKKDEHPTTEGAAGPSGLISPRPDTDDEEASSRGNSASASGVQDAIPADIDEGDPTYATAVPSDSSDNEFLDGPADSDALFPADNSVSSGAQGGLDSPKQAGCVKHGGEEFVAYCQDCKSFICLDCMTGNEASHDLHQRIRIKQLLAKPDLFSETLSSLTALVDSKKKFLDDLSQAESDMKDSHRQQVQGIRDLQQTALGQLNVAYTAQLDKLNCARDKQRANINKVADDAVAVVKRHEAVQLTLITGERGGVLANLPGLSDLTTALQQALTLESLPALVAAREEGEEAVRKGEGAKTVTGVQNTAPDFTTSGFHDFPELDVRVSALPPPTSGVEVQTEEEVSVIRSDYLPGVRDQIMTLIPKNTSSSNYNSGDKDQAVIDRDFHKRCREFGEGTSNVLPVPFQEPAVSKPLSSVHDITYITSSDAAALTSLLGGKRTLSRKQTPYNIIHLVNDTGNVMCCGAALHDKYGERHVNKSGKADTGACYLPACAKIGEVLEEYLGWRPSVVKGYETGKLVDMGRTVRQWTETCDSYRLTVLK